MAKDLIIPELKNFIQAGYPALFLRTIEPVVAQAKVLDAMKALAMDDTAFGVWKVTTGLYSKMKCTDDTQALMEVRNANDLLDALTWIEDEKEARNASLVVFHNLRQFITNPGVIQKLVDAIYRIKAKGSHIVMIGPHIELPPELRNLVQFVDFPLPTRDELEADFTVMVDSYADDIKLPSKKSEKEELIRNATNAALGLDRMAAENAISLSIATALSVDIRIIQKQKEQEVKKSDVLEFFPIEETIDDLGGFQALKEWLGKRRRAFTEEAIQYGLHYPRGFLVVGPAGTGKSLCAKVAASFFGLPLLRFDIGRIFRSLVGESEAAVRQALAVAEAVSPVILWLDEIEKGMAGMQGSGELDSGVTARVVSTILTWRQETKKPVMLIATANNVATLPSMVYRKGRMDEVWATDLPNEEERTEIFRIHLRKRKRDPDKFNVQLLSSRTDGFVGAEIEGVIEDAMFAAFDEEKEVGDRYILKAITETIPQSIRDSAEIDAIRSWVKCSARLVSGGEKPAVAPTSTVRKIHKGGRTK